MANSNWDAFDCLSCTLIDITKLHILLNLLVLVGERGEGSSWIPFFLLPPPGCLTTRRHQLPRLVVSFSSTSRLESARRECSSSWAPPGRESRLESMYMYMYMYYNYTLHVYTQRHYFVNFLGTLGSTWEGIQAGKYVHTCTCMPRSS